jgi:hypothetical protein
MEFMRERPLAMGTIDAADLERFYVTDSPIEAAERIRDVALKNFGLRYAGQDRRRRFLFE